jgi:tRNA A-37 threonylcarbamoyl transferase component Bud32
MPGQGDAAQARIPGYELVRKLGEGSMGATYLARQSAMDRMVVVKVLRKELSRDAEYIMRFQREARLAGRLEHENIVQVITVGQAGAFHYIVMEYVEGKDLWDLLPAKGSMDHRQALNIALQVAKALDCAEARGIIHRDIKPENILVTAGGTTKLCDFGLAKRTKGESRLTQVGSVVGTAHYIAPEQARGAADVDIRSDIYALGATLYHMVTGETPFSGDNPAIIMTKHLTEQMPWPADVNPDVSQDVCRLIEKMMAKERKDRYQTPAEVVEDIESIQAGQAPRGAALPTGRSSVGRTGTVPVAPVKARPRRRRPSKRVGKQPVGGTDLFAPARKVSPAKKLLDMPRPVLIGLGAAGFLALIVIFYGVFSAMRGVDGPPESTASPQEIAEAKEAWSQIHKLAGEKITGRNAQELLFLMKRFEDKFKGTGLVKPKLVEMDRYRALTRIAVSGKVTAADLDAMLDWARSHWEKNSGDYTGARERYQAVLEKAGKFPAVAEKIKAAIGEVERTRKTAADVEVSIRARKADGLVEKGDIDGALVALEKPPEKLADLMSEALNAKSSKILAEVGGKFAAIAKTAKRHSEEGWPGRGLAKLDRVSGFKFTLWKPRLDALRARFVKEQARPEEMQVRRERTSARNLLAAALVETDKQLLEGRCGGAVQFLAGKRRSTPDAVMKHIKDDFEALEKIARKLKRYEARRAQALKDLKGKAVRFSIGGKLVDVRIRAVTRTGFEVEADYTTLGYAKSREYQISFKKLGEKEMERLMPAFDAAVPEEHLAAMLWALYKQNPRAAAQALKSAGAHSLKAHYQKTLADHPKK